MNAARLIAALMLLLASRGAVALSPPRGGAPWPSHREGELIVRFRSTATASVRERLHRRHGSTTATRFRDARLEHVKLRKGLSVPDAVALYRADRDVELAEPNYEVRATAVPDDPYLDQLWGLRNLGQTGGTRGADIGAEAAWDLTTGSSDVVVAVLDTGIDYTHPDLAPNVWVNAGEIPDNGLDDDGDGWVDDVFGIDPTSGTADPMDDAGHGTHVAGTIGAVGNDGQGVVGVSWRVKMMACKVLRADGVGDVASVIACLDYVKARKDAGVNVVATNNSYGCPGCDSQAWRDAIDAQRDVLHVAGAGNDIADDDRVPFFPASYDVPNVLAVAATDMNDALCGFSNHGRRSVHVGAPGESIVSTLPATNVYGIGGGYGQLSGTSMATPHVTGIAALVKSRFPSADWREVKNRILAGGDRVPSLAGRTITANRVDAYGALTCTGRPAFSVLRYPATLAASVPSAVSVLSIDCARPAGPVIATLASGGSLELRDDGVAPDLAAGDGVFTASFTPVRDADRLAFSSPAGAEAVVMPALKVASTFLREGNTREPYLETLTGAGGLGARSWSVAEGSLPPGLALDASTGVIAGRPTATGAFPFTAQVTDAWGDTATKPLQLSVGDDGVVQEWVRTFDAGGRDGAGGVALAGGGRVYVAGQSQSQDSSRANAVALAYDAAGGSLWASTWGEGGERGLGVASDPSGDAVVVGVTVGADRDAVTRVLDPAGSALRAERFDLGGDEVAFAVVVDAGGNVYEAGAARSGATWDFLVLKYAPDGRLAWARTYDRGANEQALAIALARDGGVVVTGIAYDVYYSGDALTVKYDAAGNLLWTTAWDADATEGGTGVAVDAEGNAYVGANTLDAVGGFRNQLLLIKYDAQGNVLWSRTHDAPDPLSSHLALDGAGNAYLLSSVYGYNARIARVVKFDPAGRVLWEKTLDAGQAHYWVFGGGIAVGADDAVYVAGGVHNGVDEDLFLAKFRQVPGDFRAPAGSIVIEQGAGYVYSTSVTLALACDDGAGSGCATMQLSGDGVSWSAPEPFAAARAWTLPPGDGRKTVWVRYHDGAGNASLASSDDVVYSARRPDLVTRDVRAPDAVRAGTSFTVSGVAVNAGRGIAGPSSTAVKLKRRGPGAAEVPLASVAVPELSPGASAAWAGDWTLPPGTRAGDYDLVVVADDGRVVPETDEQNNVTARPIRVRQ